ncbi:MAG: hypothetical protein ACRDZ4_22055 [Egibacteraceae bacterium]
MATGSEVDGGVLRDLRRIRLMEQLDLANAACVIDPGCALSREDVSAYERGTKQPAARKLHAILRALNSAVVLGKPAPLSDAEVRALIATPSLDAALPAEQEDGADCGAAAKTVTAGLPVAFMPPDALERITYTLGKPAHIDGCSLDALERLTIEGELTAVTYRYRRMDAKVASWRLIEPVAAHLRFLGELYCDAAGSRIGSSLAAAVSEAAGLAAWLCFDMGDAARAHAHYRHAVRAAGAAGDPLLGGYMVGSMAWLAVQVGDGDAALELVQAAKSKIGPIDPETPATSCAWLAVHEALAQATLRDARKAFTLLDRAGDAVTRAASEAPVWPWLYPFSPDKLVAFSGSCYLRLGRANEARSALQKALRLRPAGGTARATVLIDLAGAHLMRPRPEVDVDETCQLVAEAAGIAANKGSARLWRQVRETRTRLQPWRTSRAVRQLDERLRSYVG